MADLKGWRSAAQNAAGGQSSAVCTLSKSADAAKLGGAADTPGSGAAIQRDLGGLGRV